MLLRCLTTLVVAAGLAAASLTPAAADTTGGRDHDHHRPGRSFDLQAHRGGLGLVVESILPAFANALELGVSTLELDVQITRDGEAVVTHDRRISDRKCRDTQPATPGDPQYPYVGSYIKDLTLAQVRTLDCGSQTLPEYPGQRAAPGERMPLLREEFVQVVVAEIRRARLLRQATVQSFDWGALMRVREVEPRLPIVALTNHDFLQTGQPGASPWLGGIDIDDFDGDPVAAVDSFGADAFSPVHGFPQNGTVGDPDYRPYVDAAMVARAHRRGIEVVPWTVNDPATMHAVLDTGVDGLITDYPDRLRTVMQERGLKLPKPYRPRGRA